MNLLYDLPVELQQIILTEALNMQLHRVPQLKLLDDRPFYFAYWFGHRPCISYTEVWWYRGYQKVDEFTFERVHEAQHLDFMLYVKGIY